jgi:amino acid adenylation domain-containing protein
MADVNLEDRLKAVVARITGHRPQDLDREMFLEGDLGLDSIKTVELINNVIELVPEDKRERFNLEVSFQRLAQIQSLGELIDVMAQWQADPRPEPPPPAALAAAVAAAPVPAPSSEKDLEILHAQYPFLVAHWAISSCSLSSRIRLRGPFDPRAAREAWNDLIARHPILKARFADLAGTTSLTQYRLIWSEGAAAPAIPVADLRHLRPEAQDAFLADEMHRALDKVWDLDRWPLHSLSAFQLAPDVHDLVFANHHLISDGLGNQIMVRDFLELYRARATGQRADLPAPLSFEAYANLVRTLNSWHDERDEKALADFVKRQGKERFVWNPRGTALTTTRAQTRFRRHRLSVEATAALKERVREIRIPLNSILVGAYLKALSRIGAAPESFILNIPTSGRVYPEADASDLLGCFAQNLALTFKTPGAEESWLSLLSRVHREIEGAILAGYDRAQTRQAAVAAVKNLVLKDGRVVEPMASLVRAGVKSNLYLPFIGQTRLQERYGPLELVDYEAATATNPGTLDNLVEIFHGSLQITSNYDRGFFDAPFVDSLMAVFLRELESFARTELQRPTVSVAPASSRDASLTARLREVVEEVCHQRVGAADLDKDFEADLGLDSLERIRIVTRLHTLSADVDRQKLLACRTLREMAEALAPAPMAASGAALPATIRQGPPAGIPYMCFVEQARRRPQEPAVVFGEATLTYGELHALSNRLANHLRAAGVGRGHLVGIMTRPGPLMLVGMLAIQKAGGAYVPLDPDYPASRLAYITQHSGLEFLLTESGLAGEMVPSLDPDGRLGTVLLLDEARDTPPLHLAGRRVVGRTEWTASPETDPVYLNGPDDLMTVLYTSGSTGRPKGAMLAHRGYMNRLQWMQDAFQLAPGDRVAQKTSCCFDISVWELFWPLMFGAVVCPVERETVRNPWKLARWIEETRINVMHFVPSLFGEFLAALEGEVLRAPHLRQLVFSGEALPVPLIQRWIDRFGMRVCLANLYGPTEASIDVSAHFIQRRPSEEDRRIPIGKAIDNVDLMVLDEQMRPCPQGELGELWIGGIQLAKGYLNNPEATAEAFHRNPFPHVPGELLYRTGDLVSQLPDGSFDYHGRRDTQVKIRGFRVELGEIEGALNSHPAVDESAVLAVDYGDGQKRLVAWLAGRSAGLDFRAIKEYLQQRLPEYMVPHRVEWAVRLPKNPNGKLDRKALRELLDKEDGGSRTDQTPQTDRALTRSDAGPAPAGEEYALGPAQRWLVNYFEPPYRWSGYTRFRYRQPLDLHVFDRALGTLVKRHPALRTIFHQRDGRWYQQVVSNHPPFTAEYRDGSHLDEQTRDAQIRALLEQTLADLRLDRWPLWRILVVKVDDSCYEIAVAGHHLISDLLSNALLFDEMWRAYGHLLVGDEDGLGAAPASFTDFVQLLERETGGGRLEADLEYWRSRFPSREYKFDVPLDHRLGANVEASSTSEVFRLPVATNRALLQDAKARYGSSLYGLLLAPLYRALAEWTGQTWVVLSHRTHGRDLGDGRTFFEAVGDFAVNFPVGVAINREEGWKTTVESIAKAWREVPMRGVTYDLLSDRLPAYLYPDTNLTPVRANYLGNRTAPRTGVFEFKEADRDQRHSPADQLRTTLIEVFFSVVDGTLEMEINYSRNFHGAETIRRLGERYLALMDELVAKAPPLAQSTVKTVEKHSPALIARPVDRPGSLAGKVAIVTGGGRGLGRTTALALAQQGASVAVVSRTAAQLAETVEQIRAAGAEALAIAADVSDLGQVEAMMRQVVGQLGGLDILVNNAGITGMSSLLDSDPAEWRGIVETNLFGTYHCCRAAVPHLLARGGGKIVNIGSDSSLIGYPLFSAYAASKHGLLGLTKSLAEELKQRNVQVNAVCPSFVDTEMTPRSLRGRALPTEKVAEVVLFLASSAADSITGEALRVFGTQDMYWYGSQKMNLLQKSVTSVA